MKSLALIFVTILILSCSQINTDTSNSEVTSKLFKLNKTIENNGRHVTSNGELRTLIVYVTFSDDSKTKSDAWKYSKTELPVWTRNMINPTTNLNFPHENLTQYFYEMSHGNLMLYGDIYPEVVVPKHEEKYYKNISEVNSEVLLTIDKEVDFSKYDNWSKGKDGKYVNVPDGKVDAIFIVYRNFENRLYFNNGWTGIAHLHLKNDISTNDGVKIGSGRLDKGSGISSRGGKNGYAYMKYVLAHEFGHLLFGSGHIENTTHLALMTGGPVWNASRGMHSWEKEKLGWINYTDISMDKNHSEYLEDYHTFGEAYRIKLSDREWYVFENHQGLSKHDWAKDKGLYIYHINNANRFAPSIAVKCADGNWIFDVDEKTKKLVKTMPNHSGRNELNFRKIIKKKSYACYGEVYEDNSAWGDKYDAFDNSYNNIFSPMSNPPSQNSENKEFAIEVKKNMADKLLINFYFKDIYKNTPPAKPQVLNVTFKASKAFLNWIPNTEPDIKEYGIYYSFNSSTSLKKIKTLKNDKTSSDIMPLLSNKQNKVNICISVIDNTNKESVNSNFVVLEHNPVDKKWEWRIKEEI